jgi:acetyl esterase/lipase
VYYAPKDAKPLPVVINIHGGGWNHGNKESQGGFASWFKLGFAVANVEYRLTPQATAPAAIEDVRCAMLYLVKHAKELNIDPNRIVFAGTSAGAHLALLAGLLQNNHHFDTNCLGIDGFKVVAIIDQYGIADVWDWAYGPNIRSKSATNWLGARAKDEAFAASLSPISYVTKASPPTLIVHGDADPVVPYQESVALYKKYQDAGVVSQFITVSGGKHGGFDKEKKEEIVNAIAQFLKGLKVIE